jgi:hypothetical protein
MRPSRIFLFFWVAARFSSSLPCHAAVQAPVLKWAYGGCYYSWCELGWYSSPAVADLNRDGEFEIIASAYSVVVLKGADGEVVWRLDPGKDTTSSAGYSHRTWPGIWVQDIDNDQIPEIITAHGGGIVSAYDVNGVFKPGWPQLPTSNEFRSLFVHDIDNNQTAEIIVSAAIENKTNTWVFEHDGTLRGGWPQISTTGTGSAWGVYNDNIWAEDLDADGQAELFIPSDVTTVCAYKPDGSQLAAAAIYGTDKTWCGIGTWEDLTVEKRGWGACDGVRPESYRSNFAHGASVVADMDGDGVKEIIVSGNMYDCHVNYPPSKYSSIFIFNLDRSRFKKGAWDWEQAPVDTGVPLSEDYNVIESCQPNPVVVDLDGDGEKEILFAAYDGKVHAWWLDKSEHDNWPYSVYNASEGFYRFASEPVVADLDNDGCAEVIFTSWPQKTSSGLRLGKLYLLDCHGNLLFARDLPAPKSSSRHTNGALPAPTIANIDADPDYELVLNTTNSGFVAYDLPGSSNAKIQWQSGRNRNFTPVEEKKQLNITPQIFILLGKQ